METNTALPRDPKSRFLAQIKQLADIADASRWIATLLGNLNLRLADVPLDGDDGCLSGIDIEALDAESFMGAARYIMKAPGAKTYSPTSLSRKRTFYIERKLKSLYICVSIREELAQGYDLESFVAACQLNAPIAMPAKVAS